MKKYIVSYNLGKGNVSQVRYADSKEEAMQKLCKQYGWGEHICWLGKNDWSDGIFTKCCGNHDEGFEFRIHEVKTA